jgi:tetratricopeptide (TPR) repeat protein
LIDGDWPEAIRMAERALDRLGSMPRLERARARMIIGHANFDAGDAELAIAAYSAAAAELRDAGAARQAAQVWRELADSLAELGRAEEALDAYRQAADSAGVRVTPGHPKRARERSHAAARTTKH